MMKYLLSTLLLFIIYPTLMAYEGKEIKDELFFKDIISKALVCESSHQETLLFFECYTTELKKNIETLLKEPSTKTDDLFNANVFLLEEANSCFVVSQAIEQKIENSTKRKKTLLALEKSLFFACILQDISNLKSQKDREEIFDSLESPPPFWKQKA